MKKKLCRALGLLLSFTMLSTDLGSIAVSAADTGSEVSTEAGSTDDESASEETAGETVSEDGVSGNEAVSENETEEETTSENEADEEEESASENEAEEEESASENEAEEEESASENEADEKDETEDDVDDPTYKILDESLFKVKECNIDAGSYAATAEIVGKIGNWNYDDLAVIYTSKENAEFFPDADYATAYDLDNSEDYLITDTHSYRKSKYSDEDNGYIYYYYIDLVPEYSDKLLSPNTTYTYQVVSYRYEYDSSNYQKSYKYYFLGAPASFTTGDVVTKSQVSFNEVKVVDKGYCREKISVTLENPGNEKNGNVEIVEKGVEDPKVICTLDYDADKNVYTGGFRKNEKDLELRVGTYTGQGELGYARRDLAQDFLPDKDATLSVSFNEAEMNLIATGEFSPYYKIDDLNAYLYYKKSTSTSWYSQNSDLDDDGSFTVTMASSYSKLDPDSEYQYYFVIGYYDYSISKTVALRSEGSKDEPRTFKTGASKTYEAEDFKDEAFYNYLKDYFGEDNLTNAVLESKTSFSVNYYNDIKYIMKTLEDIPEKMPNLTSLTIQSQDISDISPLLKMKYLRSVDLDYNDISSLGDLSGVKWTYLSLYGNLLDAAAIASAKIPSSVDLGWSQRIDVLNTSDIYYIDAKGIYPIILEYMGKKSGRKYTASISINGIGKTYDSWNGNLMTVTTAKDDFNLEEGKSYTAKIVINESIVGKVFEGEREFKIEKIPEGVEDIYGTTGSSYVYVNIYLPADEYSSDMFTSLEVKLGNKVYFRTSDIYVDNSNRTNSLYKDVFEYVYNIQGLDYKAVCISASLSMLRIPVESKDYDLVLNKTQGDPEIWEKKVHITSEAVVTGINVYNYDNAGSYYFIKFDGYNLNEKAVFPVITDEPDGKGNEYTKLNSMIRLNADSVVYKLEKKENWADINKASDNDYYYVSLKGNKVNDKTSAGSKKIRANYLKDKAVVNLSPIRSYYNWKTQTFEFVFDSSVKKGTKLDFAFFDGYDGDKVATANAEVGDNGITSVKPIAGDTVYFPKKDYWQYYSVTDGERIVKKDFYVQWYNWSGNSGTSNDYFSISKSKTYFVAPAKEIELTVRASASKHKTDKLYAKINGTDEKKEFTYSKVDDVDTFTFDTGKWEFSKPLEVGAYTIAICETVDGKEVELGTSSIYVRDKSKFYATYANGNLNRDDLTKASIEIDMPYVDVPDTEKKADLEKIVNDLKLKIEIFDADFNTVKADAVPYKGVSGSGAIYFNVTGLDKEEYMYYVRITSDGKTPLRPSTDEEYYDDTAHGNRMTRSTYFGISDSSQYNAYYCLYTYDLKNQPPFTLNIYSMSMPDKLVTSITVEKDDIDKNGYYYFSKKDVEKLDANTVYYCVVIANNQRVNTYTGYFASKDSGAAYNPNKITLKVNKKENITATLVLNTNGADPVTALYTMAKSGKSAKMTKLTKRGYTFNGWYVTYTTAKGAAKQKKVTSITAKIIKKYALEGTLTLDAKFTPNKYSISYKKTAPAKKVKVKGKIKLLKEEKKLSYEGGMVTAHGTELTADGYKLVGWATVKGGAAVINVGETKPVSELIPEKGKKITFYPVWEVSTPAE